MFSPLNFLSAKANVALPPLRITSESFSAQIPRSIRIKNKNKSNSQLRVILIHKYACRFFRDRSKITPPMGYQFSAKILALFFCVFDHNAFLFSLYKSEKKHYENNLNLHLKSKYIVKEGS